MGNRDDLWRDYAWGVLTMMCYVLIVIFVASVAVVLWSVPWLAVPALIVFGVPAGMVWHARRGT